QAGGAGVRPAAGLPIRAAGRCRGARTTHADQPSRAGSARAAGLPVASAARRGRAASALAGEPGPAARSATAWLARIAAAHRHHARVDTAPPIDVNEIGASPIGLLGQVLRT